MTSSTMQLELIPSQVRVSATWFRTGICPRIRIVFDCYMTSKIPRATKGSTADRARNTRTSRRCEGSCVVEDAIGSLDTLRFYRREHVGLNIKVLDSKSRADVQKVLESRTHLAIVVLNTHVCISSDGRCQALRWIAVVGSRDGSHVVAEDRVVQWCGGQSTRPLGWTRINAVHAQSQRGRSGVARTTGTVLERPEPSFEGVQPNCIEGA